MAELTRLYPPQLTRVAGPMWWHNLVQTQQALTTYLLERTSMTPASLNSLQRRLKDRIRARRTRSGSSGRCGTSFRPSIDQLEKRNLLTTFMVINPIDGEEGSLRDAIEQANATTGPDTIKFDLDVQDIQVSGQIVITDKLTIDGPGADELTVNGDGDRVFAVVPSKYADETDLFTTPTPEQLAVAPSVKIEGLTIANGTGVRRAGSRLRAAGFRSAAGFTTSVVKCTCTEFI